jgi:hypothetical protein
MRGLYKCIRSYFGFKLNGGINLMFEEEHWEESEDEEEEDW